jgi:RimJ/RimL family protein N-acetyltransferase
VTEVVFATARLAARRLSYTDIDSLVAVYGDVDAMRWVGDGRAITRAECEEWVRVTLANYAERGYGMFALEDRATGSVIGFCGIVHPGGRTEAEIKYALRRSHWGRGLATEAVLGLLEYGARCLGLSRIMATTAPANVASHRVLLKSGLERGEPREDADGSRTQPFFWRRPGSGDG